MENAERKLIDQLENAALYHFVYYYKGDNITKNLYEAAAPLYDLFITSIIIPKRQSVIDHSNYKVDITIH